MNLSLFIHLLIEMDAPQEFITLLLLSTYSNNFLYLAIERKIKKYQQDYYKAISTSNALGNSTTFLNFILRIIL